MKFLHVWEISVQCWHALLLPIPLTVTTWPDLHETLCLETLWRLGENSTPTAEGLSSLQGNSAAVKESSIYCRAAKRRKSCVLPRLLIARPVGKGAGKGGEGRLEEMR